MRRIYPRRDEFLKAAEEGRFPPLFMEIPADIETPVSLFLKLGGEGRPLFLLESAERGEKVGRYSFLGAGSLPSFELRGEKGVILEGEGRGRELAISDPLKPLRDLLPDHIHPEDPRLPPFSGGIVGYMGYDVVRFFEPRVPPCPQDELGLPDMIFFTADTLIAFDHLEHKAKIIANPKKREDPLLVYEEAEERISELLRKASLPLPPPPERREVPRELSSNFTKEEFCRAVEIAKEYIAAGEALQIVISQRLRRRTSASPFAIYRALRMLNPSPYVFFLDFGDFQLIGSSPEMLVRKMGRRAETRPIAGTRPRGRSPEEDEKLCEELLSDPKERAEHVMLVDLARNDLGRVCRFGTVRVPELMIIEKYSHVSHIVSGVEGILEEGRDAFDLLRACFPAGTVSGAPKVRAMEIISELERMKRGPYAGAVGYISFNGNMDTCITIRTIVMIGDTVYLQAGAGIVADSIPEREYEETLNKVKALEKAVELAEEIFT